jgi:hypothetical protein
MGPDDEVRIELLTWLSSTYAIAGNGRADSREARTLRRRRASLQIPSGLLNRRIVSWSLFPKIEPLGWFESGI